MIEYTLKHPAEYSQTSIVSVQLFEPKTMHLSLVAKIKQGYNAASLDMLKRLKDSGLTNDAPQKEVEASDDIQEGVKSLLSSACVGTDQIYENMHALLRSDGGICKIVFKGDSIEPASRGYLNAIGVPDFMNICAEYIAAFIAPAS